MQNRKIFFWIFLILLPFVKDINAQNNTSSPYSRYGIGDLSGRGFTTGDAMGGIGIGVRTNKNINILNPASYTKFDSLNFMFEFGVKNKATYFKTNSLDDFRNDANISYLAAGFPISKYVYSSFGLIPLSSVGYNIKETVTTNGINRDIFYTGTGGINKAFIGLAFKPHKNISLGVNSSYLFGSIDQGKIVKFTDTTNVLFLNTRSQNFVTVSDIYFNYGIQYHNKIKDKYEYTLGMTVDAPFNVNATRNTLITTFYNKGGSSTIDTIVNTPDEKGSIAMPMGLGFGASFGSDNFLVGADFNIQNWSDAKIFGKSDSLANSTYMGIGGEYTPDKSSIASYWRRVAYRVGMHYSKTYLQFVQKNEQLNDYGISFGMGLPLKKARSLVNVSFEIGQRGTTSKNLIRETYGIISVNFSFTEVWFQRTKFD